MTELLLARRGTKKEEVPTIPGTPWQGGFYAGLIQVGADIYALVVAPKALGGEAPGTLAWKTSATTTTGTTSVNDGWANTQVMATAGLANHPAAQFCRGLSIGGFNDWYLPAKDELEILYRNFKPTTQANNTNYAANSSSVPPTSNYTSGNPAQTSIALFKEGGAEAFIANAYWSSTQSGVSSAWDQYFDNGRQLPGNKMNVYYVRAVRRIKVEFPDPPESVGAPYEGGFYAGRIWHPTGLSALVVAPKSLGGEAPGTLTWKTSQTTTAGTDSVNDGVTNTNAMMAAGAANHPAAQFCRGLSIGGYNDWYLPAKDELEILYRNFKPTTQANNTTGWGANSSSVPPTSNYTSGNPAQTSIALFKEGGAEAFTTADRYWSSTEYSSSHGWVQLFSNGPQSNLNKTLARYVRAVRRVHQPIYVAKD